MKIFKEYEYNYCEFNLYSERKRIKNRIEELEQNIKTILLTKAKLKPKTFIEFRELILKYGNENSIQHEINLLKCRLSILQNIINN